MKTLLSIAVACVGFAGLASSSVQAQNPAGPSSATGTAPAGVGDNGSAPLNSTPRPTAAADSTPTTTTHHRHHHHVHRHHMHHHMKSSPAPQKPAAENPTAAPTATPQ